MFPREFINVSIPAVDVCSFEVLDVWPCTKFLFTLAQILKKCSWILIQCRRLKLESQQITRNSVSNQMLHRIKLQAAGNTTKLAQLLLQHWQHDCYYETTKLETTRRIVKRPLHNYNWLEQFGSHDYRLINLIFLYCFCSPDLNSYNHSKHILMSVKHVKWDKKFRNPAIFHCGHDITQTITKLRSTDKHC